MKKIYFFSPSNLKPTGGVKQIYRQVDILNQLQYDASVLLKKKSKKANQWYFNKKIVYNYNFFEKVLNTLTNNNISKKIKKQIKKFTDTPIEKDSIIVMPEIYGSQMHHALDNRKFVIFNQNCYYTFNHYHFSYSKDNPYLDKNCLGVIVASQDAYEYLNYVFPEVNIQKITLGIDDKIFNYSEKKRKKICYMPRKLSEDSEQVIVILKAKAIIEGWELCAIDDMEEHEVAKHLKESILFLSFNHREGFGLPPVEAMACGCYVIGYRGQAGKEYLNPEFSQPVADGDIISFVKEIEKTIQTFNEKPSHILDMGKKASEYIRSTYSLKHEIETTQTAWENLLRQL
ncbi:glycosyltransferase [Riemerella columbina]|uniref:glycosyltransferase n=1 Tax=Riemerella columbina TaxID=103810 RepID=UPI00266EADA6|nr:glycosyltransferase [Riemerella columbina]WKS95601.1 glycosyltransferase [Riemerella columbina]